MTPRSRRALRALAASSTATFVAASFHVVGGGSTPGAVTFALTIALGTLLCLLLQSAALSVWRLAVSVVLSQVAFHVLFAITGGASTLAGHDHGGAVVAPVRAVDATKSMGLAHLAAAALTIVFLVLGERVLLAVADAFAGLVLRRAARLALPPLPHSRPREIAVGARPVVLPRAVPSGPLVRRGPPLFV